MARLRLTTAIAIAVCLCDPRRQVLGSYDDGSYLVSSVKAVDQDVWHKRPPRLAVAQDLPCERPQIYICEDTPDSVPPEEGKVCDYRSQRYHEQVYRWVAGRGCLLYTPDFLYVGGNNTINLNTGCFYGTWFAPCLELPKEDGTCGCYPFDPGLEEVVTVVRQAMVTAAHGRWERCFYAASDCCSHDMNSTYYSDPNQCETTFDGWTCWQPAEAGTVSTEVCSDFAYSGQGPSCNHYSRKQCYPDATWELQTDYTPCSITPRLLRRYRFNIAVLSLSIASCLPAVFIFFFYKRLRKNTRVVLHRNLMIIIIVKNILVIISRSEIYIDELTNQGDTVMSTHGVACRVLAFAERVAVNAVFVCMLIEGVYLHRMIVVIFRSKLNMTVLYAIGAVITILPAIAWAIVMGIHDNHSCWLVYTTPNIQWILDAPRVAILLINTVLFIDVIRVLLTKVRNSENANQLNTAKATLFLMPIFGVQFILTAFRPGTDNCVGEQIYYYISYSVESLQGFIVAMLYCYVNKEVHTLLKSTYRKAETAVESVVRRDSQYPTTNVKNARKMTLSTAVSSNPGGLKDESIKVFSPKLHVAEIISIQASERLAEILEPNYETVSGFSNEGYDSLQQQYGDDDSETTNRFQEEYYSFQNASSVSIDFPDWVQTSSSYEESIESGDRREPGMKPESDQLEDELFTSDPDDSFETVDSSTDIEKDDMLGEIMQYIENTRPRPESLILDPNLLSPNRRAEDKIVFVELSNSALMEAVSPKQSISDTI